MDDATTTTVEDERAADAAAGAGAPEAKVSPFAPKEPEPVAGRAPAPRTPVPLLVTEAALGQVLNILAAEEGREQLALRVEVTGVNGAEYAYELAFDERSTAGPDDVVYGQGDLTVMIPAGSVDALWGATLDLPSTPGQAGLVIRNPNRPDPLGVADVELTGTVTERVEQLLAQVINPSLAAHGGFASLVEVIDDDTRAVITMGGGCQGCAVSAMTLREGIQKSIVEHIPEIVEVVDSTDHDAGENPYFT